MRFESDTGNFTEGVTEVPPILRAVDSTPNDSDKTFTVPNGEMWKLNYVLVTLVTTATVGNRQIVLQATNSAGTVIGRISAGAVQAASTTRYYSCMQGVFRETTFINGEIQVSIPMDTYLPAGATLRVFDEAAIDAAADDMTVSYSVKRYKGC